MHRTTLLTILLSSLLAGCADNAPDDAGPERAVREDTKTFTLPARGSIEWKFGMSRGAAFEYEWTSTRPVRFDFHGDFDDGTDEFVSHEASTLASDAGTFTIPFTGRHGWYFQNGNAQTVTITLHTRGPYEVIGKTGGNTAG